MITLRAKDFSTFLKRIHLGGAFTECVLQTTPEGMHVIGINMTNNLLAYVIAPFDATLNAGPLGLSDLGFLIKVLDKFGDANVDMEVQGNRLLLSGVGNTIRYLLSSATAIPTMPEDTSMFGTIKDKCCYAIKVDETNRGNLTTNIKLFGKPTINVGISDNNGRGICSVNCGNDTESQFTVQFGRVTVTEGSPLLPVAFEIDSEHVKAVLDVTGTGDGIPFLSMAADTKYPVILSQGLDVWAFLPRDANKEG
jgi:hypothetical protein